MSINFLITKLKGMDVESHYDLLKVGKASLTEFRSKAKEFIAMLDELRQSDDPAHIEYVKTWDKGALKHIRRL